MFCPRCSTFLDTINDEDAYVVCDVCGELVVCEAAYEGMRLDAELSEYEYDEEDNVYEELSEEAV